MGVEQEHYVIVGIKTKYKELEQSMNWTKDKFDDYLDIDKMFPEAHIKNQYQDARAGEFVYITDGMNGQYSVLGLIVTYGEGWEGVDMTDCVAAYEAYKAEVSEKLRQLGITIGKVSVFAFTHFH